ncbi:uncharacterized protein BDR25DRAFT_319573 [Lindgomyces ingoldianus]|uniref:Uncharacterized protein n=1 Tax=Lindgomyces ingoldianus TaxID=673940 RepID=A0ACB6QBU2_9PLEO|nr:uncharacterized protein BDR25DRAFT_319573 [Lindgomyces ingoldianus]KAF2463975.1 hypothetical protein BDR25DRAFT_319573 [Lindgomyces ingoldianus]
MEKQEGRATTRTICDSISSLRDANDGLKDLLWQERAPLPLWPDIMGIMERSLQSKRRAVDLVAASHPETARSMSSRIIQQSDLDRLDLLISVPYLQEEACPAQSRPAQPSPEQYTPRTSSSLSTSNSDHQALYDISGHVNDCMDILLVDSPKGEVEHCDDLGEVMADFLGDAMNITFDESLDTKTRCWKHGCNGKSFSTRSNLLRHHVEKGKARPKFTCPVCGAFFSRATARNQHVEKRSCNRIRRYSNGRERPRPRVID